MFFFLQETGKHAQRISLKLKLFHKITWNYCVGTLRKKEYI